MAQIKLRKGNVVKTFDGKEGMITYRKGNHTIAINFAHWHIYKHTKDPISEEEKRDRIYKLGCDDVFTAEQIKEVVRSNEIYSY